MKPSPHHLFVAAVSAFCLAVIGGLVGSLLVLM